MRQIVVMSAAVFCILGFTACQTTPTHELAETQASGGHRSTASSENAVGVGLKSSECSTEAAKAVLENAIGIVTEANFKSAQEVISSQTSFKLLELNRTSNSQFDYSASVELRPGVKHSYVVKVTDWTACTANALADVN